jgi:hypothetical protein
MFVFDAGYVHRRRPSSSAEVAVMCGFACVVKSTGGHRVVEARH